jgi:hypothetical protein
MAVSVGGTICQKIFADSYPQDSWDDKAVIIFTVQILNSARFRELTGITPPKRTMNAALYESVGLPYYDESAYQATLETVTSKQTKVAAALKPKKYLGFTSNRSARPPKIVKIHSENPERTYDPFQAIDEELKRDPSPRHPVANDENAKNLQNRKATGLRGLFSRFRKAVATPAG